MFDAQLGGAPRQICHYFQEVARPVYPARLVRAVLDREPRRARGGA
jgi:hypothetical protein